MKRSMKMLCDEVNRWLRVKWQHADYNRELPQTGDTFSYFEKVVNSYLSDCAREVFDACCPLPGQRGATSGTPLLGMIECLLLVGNCPALQIVSHVDGTVVPLASFGLILNFMKDGEDSANAVKEISFSGDEEETVADMVIRAHRQLVGTKKDIFELWQKTTVKFRREHPICPSCGGTVYLSREHECQPNIVFCEQCGWASRHKYYYLGEYVEGDAFRKELRRHRKVQVTTDAVAEIKSRAILCIEELDKARGNTGKYLISGSDYCQALKEIELVIETKLKEETSKVRK